MKRKLLTAVMLLVCLSSTGCNDEDMFNAGTAELLFRQPYANENGYILVNYDLKEVSVRENDILNEYDFSGPMHDMFANNSSNSTVIEPNTPEVTPGVTEGLPLHATSGFVTPTHPDVTTLTSFYGPRWGRTHQGIDFACPTGSPIYAIDDGTIAFAGYSSSAGNYIILDHKNDKNGISQSIYMHNSELIVKKGDIVQKGQQIAKAGSTGNSTGPHCHLGLMDTTGTYVDPYPYLNLKGFKVSDNADNIPPELLE